MASVHRMRGSKFWYGKFTRPDGSRALLSTKETDKSKARQIAQGWEKAARMRATKEQAQKVLADIVKAVSGDVFESVTLHVHADRWVERKKLEVTGRTHDKYAQVVRELKRSIPAHVSLAEVTTSMVSAVRDDIALRTSIASANDLLKVIKAFFAEAYRDGKIPENPAMKLKPLNDRAERERRPDRRPFRIDEVESILGVLGPEEEWYGMTLLGAYSGQRLGDVAKAERGQITDGVWRFRSGKTKLDMRVGLAIPVLRWLERHGPKKGALFPKAASVTRTGTLSNQFYAIMTRAGIVPRRPHRKKKDAPAEGNPKRLLSELGFHSFRHTTQTWLMEAGASRELAMAHVGHEDEKVSRGYTHIGTDALRPFVDKLPQVSLKRSA